MLFINTTGFGYLPEGRQELSLDRIRPGDKVILSGSIGDHGIAILSERANLQFGTQILSDSASLYSLTELMLENFSEVKYMQDPTRGGLSGCLNEISFHTKMNIEIDMEMIPVKTQVRAACELLGIDPLTIANEGKLVAICSPDIAEKLVKTMQKYTLGREAVIIGEVKESIKPRVILNTQYGSQKILHWNAGDQLPRIC